MTWLPICLFLVLFAHNAKPDSQFSDRLPRDVDPTTTPSPTDAPSSTTAAPTSTTAKPTSTSTSTTTAPTSTTAKPTSTSTTDKPASTSTTSAPDPSTSESTPATSTATSTAPPSSTSPPDEPKDGDECDAESLNTIVCENDRLRFCGPNNKIMSVQCVVKGKQGYCNCEKTGCVAKKPVCPGDKTKCYEPNTKLPDNTDCHKFTYCNENKEKSTFECPGNLIYDMTAEKCTDRHSARCHKISCPGKDLKLVPFPQAKNYYLFCYNGVGDVRKCPDQYYGVRDNACQFDCKLRSASGLFKDTNVERCKEGYYYACKRSGSNYITTMVKCPKDLTFDEDIGLCTKEDTCTESETENN